MHSDRAIVKAAWLELWSTGLISLAGCLLFLLGSYALSSGSSPPDRAPWWPLPALLAALWGGVLVAGGPAEERIFFLARPVGRLRLLGLRLGVLLPLLGTGLLAHGLVAQGLGLTDGPPIRVWIVASVLCVAAGLAAGSLLPDRTQALGVSLVLLVAVSLVPSMIALSEARFDDEFNWFGRPHRYTLELMLLGLATLIPAVLRDWIRWFPLRTGRSSLSLSLLLGAGVLASSALLWWFVPAGVPGG